MIYLLVRDESTYESGSYVVPLVYFSSEENANEVCERLNAAFQKMLNIRYSDFSMVDFDNGVKEFKDTVRPWDPTVDASMVEGYSIHTVNTGHTPPTT